MRGGGVKAKRIEDKEGSVSVPIYRFERQNDSMDGFHSIAMLPPVWRKERIPVDVTLTRPAEPLPQQRQRR